ncbi:ATP-binding protein [Actinomadura parmotrematis]|nr:ATP-binding protein [Actinomadura parmotrematis]
MKFSLALPREALSIPVVRRVVGDSLRGLGVADDVVDDILLALSEACTNVVQHARTSGDYEVTARIDDESCRIAVMDWGRGLRHARPEPDELAESGRGIRIMRALMDELDISAGTDSGTVVHLRKRLTWRDEALIRRLEHRLMHSAG